MKISLTTLISFLFLLFLGFCETWAEGTKEASITAITSTWDFGYVPMDYKLIHFYKIRNDGDAELQITKLVPNCDCTSAQVNRKSLPPDSITEVKIVFETKDYYGPNTRNITVHTNDPAKPTIALQYSSNIGLFPKLYRTEPNSLFFLPGHKSKEIRLINDSDSDIQFALDLEQDSLFAVNKIHGTITPGSPIVLTVMPKENMPKGTHYSNFTVAFKGKQDVRLTVPVKIVRY